MKVGVSLFVQNYVDWDRFEAIEADPEKEGLPQLVTDAQIYQEQFHLGKLVEPLGYDSLWTVEHHFTPYTMVTSPTQFLAYFAGQTSRIDMGTMVTVLPWHDPLRAAEGYIALDHMLNGRGLKIGVGRGLGLREYDGMRVNMNETREIFKESLDVVREAFSKEWFSFDGNHHHIPRTTMRPLPRPGNKLVDSLYIAWGSPQSMPVAAHENCKPLFIPQRSWDEHKAELVEYNRIRTEEHGWEPERPTTVVWVYCAPTDAEAEEGVRQYMTEYGDSAQRHYQMLGDHLSQLSGYEYYGKQAQMLKALRDSPDFDAGSLYLNNHVWGSPKSCIEKLKFINDTMGSDDLVGVFSYGSMPVEKAEASMRLFSAEVLPAVQAFEPAGLPQLVA